MSSGDVFAMFLESRVAAGCVLKTIKWYKFQLGHFQKWLIDHQQQYNTVKLLDLQQFVASLRDRYSSSTVSQATTAVITFYHWCMEVELIDKDPTVKLKRPKVPENIQPVAARSYVLHMLDKIELLTWVDHRDKLIIRILFSTGMRIGECVALRVQDVHLEDRRFAILCKGGRVRYAPFPDELVESLRDWLEKWRPPVRDCDWLFFASTARGTLRGPITRQAVYDTMKRRAIDAALDWVPPHGYRRGFAVDMLKHGASTRLVQALLGHASIQTTEKYLRLSPDQTQEMFDGIWEDLEG